MPFFGVFFIANEGIDITEVKKFFSKYGDVVSVRRNLSRLYVNFRFRDDAERCLNDTNNMYGKIRKGKFSTEEEQNFTKENDSSKNTGRNVHSNTDKLERKQIKSSASMDSEFESDTTNSVSSSNLECSDSEMHKGSKSISDDEKANDKISPRDPKKNDTQSPPQQSQKHRSLQKRNSSGNFQESSDETSCSEDGPPPLLSIPKPVSQNPVGMKSTVESPCFKYPLLPTPSTFPIPNRQCSSLLGAPPTASPLKQNERDSDHPPPLLSVFDKTPIPPGWSSRDLDQPPPLISTISQPFPNGSKFTKHLYSPVMHEEKKYGGHIMICNVPPDTSSYEIEKVLFPHTPIYIAEPEETNIRMSLFFCHVQFRTHEEACKAINRMDGVELRRHRLYMVTLDELLSKKTVV